MLLATVFSNNVASCMGAFIWSFVLVYFPLDMYRNYTNSLLTLTLARLSLADRIGDVVPSCLYIALRR